MRKTSLAILVLLITVTPFFGKSGESELWKTLYQQAYTVKEKRDKVKQMRGVADENFEELIISILQEQAVFPVSQNAQEKRAFEEWVFHTILLAGDLKFNSAAPWLKKIYKNTSNQQLQGEILYSIGKTGNRDLIPWLNSELYTFNLKHQNGQFMGKDELIYGMVAAMKLFADPTSFDVVFYASIPNYSSKVRIIAEKALEAITPNPAPFCTEIIKNDRDLKIAIEAMRYAVRSNSPREDKIETCVIAIREGIERVTSNNIAMEETRQQMMDEAVYNLGTLKAGDKESIRVIDEKWQADEDVSSLLLNIEALQMIGSVHAIDALHSYLGYFHDKKREGFGSGYGKAGGNKLIIAIIRALGSIGSPLSIRELQTIAFTPTYESMIMKEAEKALIQIEKKQYK
jgi:hypothetical protein